MNFLTNVTNEARHETGAGPVVEVPVGTVMRFPFASHFCIPEYQINEEIIERDMRRGIIEHEIPDFDVIELEELDQARREARREDEVRPLELGPDLMDYSSAPHWEHYEPSP